ncbi:MAG: hypothetical protein LBE22_05905 [Azoarcus sp.]|jgi:hypothetical protein|nr:hypothetical protein [Azoarcus sp.]
MQQKKILSMVIVAMLASVPLSARAFSWASVLEFLREIENEMSTWAVNVKQTALSANQIGNAERVAKQQLTAAKAIQEIGEKAYRAVVDFSPMTGQPDSIKCTEQHHGAIHVESQAQRDLDQRKLMQSYAAGRVDSRAQAQNNWLKNRRANYCTVSEAKQGMCKLTADGMQGWDTNYAGAFTELTLAPEAELAAYDYATSLIDARAEAGIDCKSADCMAAQISHLGFMAAGSMVANSIIGQAVDRRQPFLSGQ